MSQTDYYNQKQSHYKPSKQRVKHILKLAGDLRGKKVLDLGCGDGTLGKILKEKGAAIVDGADVSSKDVEQAKKHMDTVHVFDFTKDDYAVFRNDYHIIIATELVEHLLEPDKFLKKVHDIMNENTKFIVTTPNFLMWTLRIRMLFGQFHYTKIGHWDEGHVHFFTYNTLIKAVKKAGLTIEQENHIIHPKIPSFIGKLRPNLFAYQLILRLRK